MGLQYMPIRVVVSGINGTYCSPMECLGYGDYPSSTPDLPRKHAPLVTRNSAFMFGSPVVSLYVRLF